ncbi:LysR substrate-binding domain-containing protein [Vagococcus sp.]|uniref:LysR substrate-binding domain-containing protein n=1 Tax=Vagococcus sp. TaxID=1933889 RepID=UPI003F9A5291
MLDYRYNTFVTLVETKSYTRTAEIINFTQPAVTKHIQFIEKELNTTLVRYDDRVVSITNEGLYLYDKIKQLQSQINQIKQSLNNQTTLTIGASKTIGEYLISNIIEEYSDQYPMVNISLMVDHTDHLLSALKTHKIDLALISGPVDDDLFVKDIFYTDRIVLACSNNHHLANQTVDINDIKDEKLLIREDGSGLQDAINNKLHSFNLHINDFINRQTVGNIKLAKSLVKKGQSIAFFYEAAIHHDLNNKKISQIKLNNFNELQPFYLVKQQYLLNPATQSFIEKLTKDIHNIFKNDYNINKKTN